MHPIRSAALAALTALLAACASIPSNLAPARTDEPAPVVLISIDGFRADYLDRGLTPNLSRLAREGVRAAWMTPSYPSLTFPNHYTLITGLRPDRHGIVHNTMRDAALGAFLHRDAKTRTDERWWDGEPIWVGAQKAGMATAVMMWPGTEATFHGLHPTHLQVFDAKIPLTARVDTVLGWLNAVPVIRPRVTAFYINTVDKAGHDFGPDAPETNAAIADADAAIGRLLDGLAAQGSLERTNLVIVSDHGMAAVAPANYVALEDMVDATDAEPIAAGQSIAFSPLPGREAAAEARLLGAHPQYDCWRKQALPARWHYGNHPRVPAIVCQMHEGWNAFPRASIAKGGLDRGSHGYDPALPSMRALFVANGPAFRRGVQLPAFDNVDVYPLLARLIGITPAANDGEIAPLLPALQDADAP